ncbi:Map3k12 [Scenedesmus sp. PABB004]|nr:Map3k12 [Scenedesmus sp. PABB004]
MGTRRAPALAGALLLGVLGALAAPAGAPAVAPAGVAHVSDEGALWAALAAPDVASIVLEQDILWQPGTPERLGYSRERPLRLARAVNLTSSPPWRRLDFAFLGDGQLQLAPGVMLSINATILAHARYGVGVGLDFLANSPGAFLVLADSIQMRLACVPTSGEPDAVRVQPRLPGFPGHQEARYLDQVCVRRACYSNALRYDDYTKLTGTPTEDTAAGGYAIIMRNFTKVCMSFVRQCAESTVHSAERCVQDALDDLADVPTPGQRDAAAAAASRRAAALAAGLGAGLGAAGAAAAAALALLLWRRRRRARRGDDEEAVQRRSGKRLAGHSGSGGGLASASTGSTPEPPCGAAAVLGPRGSPVCGGKSAAFDATSTPPSGHNSWELAACKTSQHFLHASQHQHSGSAELGGWPMRGPRGGSRGSGLLSGASGTSGGALPASASTADLIAGTCTGSDRVTLGVLLGAGSYGRVYRGRWRGMDVAVKVLQHSRRAANSVANEVDLMMGFRHPHVVSAHHFVSWRKRGGRTLALPKELGSGDAWLDEADTRAAADASAGDWPVEGTGGTEFQEELLEDTVTWIVQEFCDAGSLAEYRIHPSDRPGEERLQLPDGHAMLRLLFRLREVADGMSHLHERGVVHGDLKSGNVMLCVSPSSPYGRVAKITDFGLSRAFASGQTHRSTHTLGTVSHMAPELLRWGKMSPPVDVFSFGIMMWELLTGRAAYSGQHYGAIIEHVALLGERPAVPAAAPEDFSLLMGSCWHADPAQRPTFEQVVRCLDIMITARQQELAEAKSGSGLFDGPLRDSPAPAGSGGPACVPAGSGSPACARAGSGSLAGARTGSGSLAGGGGGGGSGGGGGGGSLLGMSQLSASSGEFDMLLRGGHSLSGSRLARQTSPQVLVLRSGSGGLGASGEHISGGAGVSAGAFAAVQRQRQQAPLRGPAGALPDGGPHGPQDL